MAGCPTLSSFAALLKLPSLMQASNTRNDFKGGRSRNIEFDWASSTYAGERIHRRLSIYLIGALLRLCRTCDRQRPHSLQLSHRCQSANGQTFVNTRSEGRTPSARDGYAAAIWPR